MDLKISKLLSELEEREANPLIKRSWSVPRSTGEFLNAMVGFMGAVNVLEIGTSNGYSGIWLAEALSRNNGRLFTVESNEERFDVAKKKMESVSDMKGPLYMYLGVRETKNKILGVD